MSWEVPCPVCPTGLLLEERCQALARKRQGGLVLVTSTCQSWYFPAQGASAATVCVTGPWPQVALLTECSLWPWRSGRAPAGGGESELSRQDPRALPPQQLCLALRVSPPGLCWTFILSTAALQPWTVFPRSSTSLLGGHRGVLPSLTRSRSPEPLLSLQPPLTSARRP